MSPSAFLDVQRRDAPLHGRDWALTFAVGTVWGLGIAFVAANAAPDMRFERALLQALVVGVPAAVGIYARLAPGTARFGLMLIGAALLWSLTGLAESSASLPYSVGRVAVWMVVPSFAYLMLAFPDGRVAERLDRHLFVVTAALLSATALAMALVADHYPVFVAWASCDADCPRNAFAIVDPEPAFVGPIVDRIGPTISVLLVAGVTLALLSRMSTATLVQRRLELPLITMTIVWVVLLVAFFVARGTNADAGAVDTLGLLTSLCLPAIAAACFVGLLRRRLLIGEVLRQLSVTLGSGAQADPAALARIGPTSAMLLTDDERAVAALLDDPRLREDELLVAASSLVLATIRQQRLTRRLTTSLGELAESRMRIARAADLERSRIERDLHDGAQQRLIALRMRLSLAEELLADDPTAAARAMREAGTDIEVALDELRALAHGVYPSLLSDRGLGDALRSVAAESPLAVHLDLGNLTRHAAEVETAVYFACVETIQNAIKHAGASGLWIALREDGALHVDVRDDGAGFDVDTVTDTTGGLRNIRDRIEAVGGELAIHSAPGSGTHLCFTVPLRERNGSR